MSDQFRVIIERPYYTDLTNIYFIERRGSKTYVAQPVLLEFKEDVPLEVDRVYELFQEFY